MASCGFFSSLGFGEEDLAGRKVYQFDVQLEQGVEGNNDHGIGKITGRVIGEIRGFSEVGDTVVVSWEDWFVKSDGWKMGAWHDG